MYTIKQASSHEKLSQVWGNSLDHGEEERRDEAWIAAAAGDEGSRFLPFRKLEVLVAEEAVVAVGDDVCVIDIAPP